MIDEFMLWLSIYTIYVQNCSVYIQCKGDIVVVDIKQHKSHFKNSNFTITQSAKFFWINFVSKFVAMATGGGREKFKWHHRIARARK